MDFKTKYEQFRDGLAVLEVANKEYFKEIGMDIDKVFEANFGHPPRIEINQNLPKELPESLKLGIFHLFNTIYPQ